MTHPDPIVAEVVDKILQRSLRGMEHYNCTMAAAKGNPAHWLANAQEELSDALIYLQRLNDDIEALRSWLSYTLGIIHLQSPETYDRLMEKIPNDLLS